MFPGWRATSPIGPKPLERAGGRPIDDGRVRPHTPGFHVCRRVPHVCRTCAARVPARVPPLKPLKSAILPESTEKEVNQSKLHFTRNHPKTQISMGAHVPAHVRHTSAHVRHTSAHVWPRRPLSRPLSPSLNPPCTVSSRPRVCVCVSCPAPVLSNPLLSRNNPSRPVLLHPALLSLRPNPSCLVPSGPVPPRLISPSLLLPASLRPAPSYPASLRLEPSYPASLAQSRARARAWLRACVVACVRVHESSFVDFPYG